MNQEDIDKEVAEYLKGLGVKPAEKKPTPVQSPAPAARDSEPAAEPESPPAEERNIFAELAKAQQTPASPSGRQPVQKFVRLTPEQEQVAAGGVGAYAGAKIAPGVRQIFLPRAQREAEGLQKLQQELQARRILEEAARVNLGQSGGASSTPLMSDVEYMSQSGRGETRPQITGRQMESSHNWETQRQSLATKQGLQRPGAASTLVQAGPGVATQSGVWIPKSAAATISATEAAAAAKQAEESQRVAATMAARQLAERTPGPLSRLGAAVTGPKVTGALGGLGAGLSAYEAYQRYKEGDRSGAVIAALGGLGGLASLFPAPQVSVPGAGINIGSLPALYINDVLKGKRPPPDRPIPMDIMGNPMPTFD